MLSCGLENLNLDVNSSNLRPLFLQVLEQSGRQLAQFCRDCTVVCRYHQYAATVPDHAAGRKEFGRRADFI